MESRGDEMPSITKKRLEKKARMAICCFSFSGRIVVIFFPEPAKE